MRVDGALLEEVPLEAPIAGVDFGDAILPNFLPLEAAGGYAAKVQQDLPDEVYLVVVKLLFAHFAVDVAEDALFCGEEDLHEVAGEVVHRSRGRPSGDDVWTGQEVCVR